MPHTSSSGMSHLQVATELQLVILTFIAALLTLGRSCSVVVFEARSLCLHRDPGIEASCRQVLAPRCGPQIVRRCGVAQAPAAITLLISLKYQSLLQHSRSPSTLHKPLDTARIDSNSQAQSIPPLANPSGMRHQRARPLWTPWLWFSDEVTR